MKKLLAIILTGLSCVVAAQAYDERIWVDARINGKPIRLILDTGSACPLALFSTTVKKLSVKYTPPDQKSTPGHATFGETEPCEFGLETNTFSISIPVIEVPDYTKLPEDGIIGWSAIKANVVSIDAVTDKISLGAHVPKDAGKWEKFKLETNLDSLAWNILFKKDIKGIITLDTGSIYGVELNSQMWYGWKLSHTNQPTTFESYGTPGIEWVIKEESWADKLSIGSIELTDVPVMEADANTVALASLPQTQFEASLGLAALKRLDIIIDGINGVAYVRPKKSSSLPYQHNRLGADFTPRDSQDDDLIAHVADGSPAYQAGIRDGDVLLKINDRDETLWRTDTNPPPEVSAVDLPAGTKLKIVLRRGDKIFKTTATLRNILPPDPVINSILKE